VNIEWNEELIITILSHVLVLVGAMLLAVQIRLQVPLGQFLPPEYQAQPPLLYVLLAAAVLIVSILTQSELVLRTPLHIFFAKSHPFRRYLVSLGSTTLGILILLPDVSQLQMVYFAVAGLILGILCIAVPYRIYIGRSM
jgi:hypothetical protein